MYYALGSKHMTLANFLKTETPRTARTYFNATWEFWKRQAAHNLWDWAVDGPFCNDPNCSQRLVRTGGARWQCIRCRTETNIPHLDFTLLRERVIRFFEEEARSHT